MIRFQLSAALIALGFVTGAVAQQRVAITDATIHTLGEAGTLDRGSLLIRDGKIAALGPKLSVAKDVQTVAGKGKVVTPGLFDALSALGTEEVELVSGTVDNQSASTHLGAAFDITGAINPRSTLIPINRIEGVTRAMVAPASPSAWLATPPGSLFAGQGSVISLAPATEFVLKPRAALFITLGEHGADFTGGSRAGTLGELREALQDAKAWDALPAGQKSTANPGYAIRRPAREVLLKALAGDLPVVARVDRASDIRAAMALAKEFGLRLIVAGGSEAWIVAKDLAAADVPVILNPLHNLPASFEHLGARPDAAAMLHRAGVLIAIADDGESHQARNIRQLAGNAVAHGLPWDAALAAVTVNPAKIYGLGNASGGLMPGQAADAVLWSGDPLEVTTMAEAVIINGRLQSMTSRQTLLRDRYLKTDGEWPPAYTHPSSP